MKKVMVVEDHFVMREKLRRMKVWGEETGFELAYEAEDGKVALGILGKEQVDLIITDIRMPRMDGIKLLQEIREREWTVEVVLLSDYQDFSYARDGIRFGALDYFEKPLLEKDLRQLFEKLQNKWKQEESDLVKLEQYAKATIYNVRRDAVTSASFVLQGIKWITEELPEEEQFSALRRFRRLLKKGSQMEFPWLEKYMPQHIEDEVENTYNQAALEENIKETSVEVGELMEKLLPIRFEGTIEMICKEVLCHLDGEIGGEIIAGKLHYNPSYLSKIFRQKTGITLQEYIIMAKMERAKKLLRVGMKIAELADLLGYRDTDYFYRVFKKYTGHSISEYKIGQKY